MKRDGDGYRSFNSPSIEVKKIAGHKMLDTLASAGENRTSLSQWWASLWGSQKPSTEKPSTDKKAGITTPLLNDGKQSPRP